MKPNIHYGVLQSTKSEANHLIEDLIPTYSFIMRQTYAE